VQKSFTLKKRENPFREKKERKRRLKRGGKGVPPAWMSGGRKGVPLTGIKEKRNFLGGSGGKKGNETLGVKEKKIRRSLYHYSWGREGGDHIQKKEEGGERP